jgi:hypothetical protein
VKIDRFFLWLYVAVLRLEIVVDDAATDANPRFVFLFAIKAIDLSY